MGKRLQHGIQDPVFRMNLCHVVPIYLPGILPGCSKYVHDISITLVTKGHRLTILTADALNGRGWVDPLFGTYAPVEEERINGIRVRRLKTGWPITASMYLLRKTVGPLLPDSIRERISLLSAGPYLSNMEKELKKDDYDVVHVTAFPFSLCWQVWKSCRALKKPLVVTPLIHFEDPAHRNPLLWQILKEATAVIACSHYELEGMIRMGVHPSRIHMVPMGIRLEEWKEADGKRFRQKYQLEGKKIILFAGTKNYHKGAIHLLDAMGKITGKMGNVTLVGMGLSTGEWEKKKAGFRQIHLLDFGYVSEEEKRDAFEACDLFAMPSRVDSFGIAYLEAWQCGKPVIGARIGAIPEVIEEGEDGLLVEFGDTDRLASAILSLLKNDDLRKQMGEKGRRKVAERFDWQKNIGRIEEVFEKAKAACPGEKRNASHGTGFSHRLHSYLSRFNRHHL